MALFGYVLEFSRVFMLVFSEVAESGMVPD